MPVLFILILFDPKASLHFSSPMSRMNIKDDVTLMIQRTMKKQKIVNSIIGINSITITQYNLYLKKSSGEVGHKSKGIKVSLYKSTCFKRANFALKKL